VRDEIEDDRERSIAIGHQRRHQTTGCHVQRGVPEVIGSWRKRKRDFADDLRPHVQGGVSVAPTLRDQ